MTGFSRLLEGKVLSSRYRMDRLIGRGGMGAVFRGRDLHLDRGVAVKVIAVDADTPEQASMLRARFRREAKAAAKLRHPNVVTLYDFGSDDELGLDFIVMELLEGEDAQARVRREGPLPWVQAAPVLLQAAYGLGAGHQAGLIHRDVKPGNLFLEQAPGGSITRTLVLDFGIAQITDDGLAPATATHLTVYGSGPLTPAYASPEQLRGDPLSSASDVFGLGIVAYELLTGELPFLAGRTGRDADPRIERAAVARLTTLISPEAASLIGASLAHDPAQRPPDGENFAQVLASIATRSSPPERSAPRGDAQIDENAETLPASRPPSTTGAPASPRPTLPGRPATRQRSWRRTAGVVLGAVVLGGAALQARLASRGGGLRSVVEPRIMAPPKTPALERRIAELDATQRAVDADQGLRRRSGLALTPRWKTSGDSARMTVYDKDGQVRKIRFVRYSPRAAESTTYYYDKAGKVALGTHTRENGRSERFYFQSDSIVGWVVNGRWMKSSSENEGYDAEGGEWNFSTDLIYQVTYGHFDHDHEWLRTDTPARQDRVQTGGSGGRQGGVNRPSGSYQIRVDENGRPQGGMNRPR